jgi:hypothetical protein
MIQGNGSVARFSGSRASPVSDSQRAPAAAWPSAVPAITSAQPLSGPVGTRVTILGSGFSDTTNTINFGVSAYLNVPSANGTIVFAIPMQTNPPCRNATPPCEIATALITPGDYALSVTTAHGTSSRSRLR